MSDVKVRDGRVRLNRLAGADTEGLFVGGSIYVDGFMASEPVDGQSWFPVGFFDEVPEGKAFSVTVWCAGEMELAYVLGGLEGSGLVSELTVREWR